MYLHRIDLPCAVFRTGLMQSVLSAQPLIVCGVTPPMLEFQGVIVIMAAAQNAPFLPFFAMTGLWASLFITLIAVFNVCELLRKCTRFTDDTFAGQ